MTCRFKGAAVSGLLCFGATSLLNGAAHAEPGVFDDRIVFGQSAAFNGPAAALGLGMREGILAAFDEANAAGGVAGHKLELVSFALPLSGYQRRPGHVLDRLPGHLDNPVAFLDSRLRRRAPGDHAVDQRAVFGVRVVEKDAQARTASIHGVRRFRRRLGHDRGRTSHEHGGMGRRTGNHLLGRSCA